MYKKWKALPEFCHALTMIEDYHRATTTAIDNTTDEAETNDECMDIENDSDQLVDDTSSEGQSMDNGSDVHQTMDASSNDEQIEDEKMASDNDREEVSLILYFSYFLDCFSDVLNDL